MSLDLSNKPTYSELLAQGRSFLTEYSKTPALDADLLLCATLGCTRLDLVRLSHTTATSDQCQIFESFLHRRKDAEPVAYILGYKEFYGRKFKVTPAVLCPRPETELLVELAINYARNFVGLNDNELQIIDLGCGSGCIAISLALELENTAKHYQVLALDISTQALEVAKDNCTVMQAKRLSFLQSDWFTEVSKEQQFNLIVSNPPYVAIGQGYSPELKFEPPHALYAENDGRADIFQIIDQVPNYLAESGLFLCEIGADQGPVVLEYAQALNFSARVHKDLAGKDRVLELNAYK